MKPERDLIVGGQAVVEGVMMRTPSAYAVAVRSPDGSIAYTAAALPKWSERFPILRMPVLRGAAVLVQSMSLGVKALNYSANQAFANKEEMPAANLNVGLSTAVIEGEAEAGGITGALPGVFPLPGNHRSGDEMRPGSSASAAGSIAIALFFNVLLFIVAPLLLTNAIFIAAGWAQPVRSDPSASSRSYAQPGLGATEGGTTVDSQAPWYTRSSEAIRTYLRPVRPSVGFNMVDGLLRMLFFLSMIFFLSLLKDIRRVFEYHGAEHKTVFMWEAGMPLTVEHARGQPRQHPRCGTSFLMVVMLVSIVLFSIIKFDSLLYNMGARIVLIPVVAGLSYEIIRLSARREGGIFFRVITRPGLWLQNITTKEPDDSQLEVAIFALIESLKLEPKTESVLAAPLA